LILLLLFCVASLLDISLALYFDFGKLNCRFCSVDLQETHFVLNMMFGEINDNILVYLSLLCYLIIMNVFMPLYIGKLTVSLMCFLGGFTWLHTFYA
jgi:hypothetical protein